MSNVNVTFNYNANVSGLLSQIKAAQTSINKFNTDIQRTGGYQQKQLEGANKAFLTSANITRNWQAQSVSLTSSTDHFAKALDRQNLKLKEYRGLWKEYRSQASGSRGMISELAKDQVRLQNSIITSLGQDASGRRRAAVFTPKGLDLSKGSASSIALARKELQIYNKALLDGSTAMINWGKNTQWAGRQLMVGLTLPMGIFANTAKQTFIDVDKELTRMQKVYGNSISTVGNSTDEIRKEVQDLGVTLAGEWGVALKETAGMAADLAATGKEGKELIDSTRETMRLSVLGEVDRQDAMKATLSLQSAFKLNNEELANSINFLNAVENQTTATLQDLVEAIPKAGPVVKGLGGSVEDLAVMMVAMREGGIDAAEGANAIKSGMASLINPTKEAQEMLKGYGINLVDIVERNKGKLMPIIMEFSKALQTMDEFSRQQAIETVFGKYQFARIGALFANLGAEGSQTLKVMDLMGASVEDLAKVADNEMKTLTESTSKRWERAVESVKAQLVPIGEVITQIMTLAVNVASKLLEVFNALPEGIKMTVIGLGAFVALVGPIIMMAGVMGNFVGYFVKFAALIRGRQGGIFQLLTKETLATAVAGKHLTETTYNEDTALKQLNGEMAKHLGVLDSIIAQNKATTASQEALTASMMETAAVAGGKGPLPPVRPGTQTVTQAQQKVMQEAAALAPLPAKTAEAVRSQLPGMEQRRLLIKSFLDDVAGQTKGQLVPGGSLGEMFPKQYEALKKSLGPQYEHLAYDFHRAESQAYMEGLDKAIGQTASGKSKIAGKGGWVSNKLGSLIKQIQMQAGAEGMLPITPADVAHTQAGHVNTVEGTGRNQEYKSTHTTAQNAAENQSLSKGIVGRFFDRVKFPGAHRGDMDVQMLQRAYANPATSANMLASQLVHDAAAQGGNVVLPGPSKTGAKAAHDLLLQQSDEDHVAAKQDATKQVHENTARERRVAKVAERLAAEGHKLKQEENRLQKKMNSEFRSGKYGVTFGPDGTPRITSTNEKTGRVTTLGGKNAQAAAPAAALQQAMAARAKIEEQLRTNAAAQGAVVAKQKQHAETSRKALADDSLAARKKAVAAKREERLVNKKVSGFAQWERAQNEAVKDEKNAARTKLENAENEKKGSRFGRFAGTAAARGFGLGMGATAIGALTGNEALTNAGVMISSLGMAAMGLEALSGVAGSIKTGFTNMLAAIANAGGGLKGLAAKIGPLIAMLGPWAVALAAAYAGFKLWSDNNTKNKNEGRSGAGEGQVFGLNAGGFNRLKAGTEGGAKTQEQVDKAIETTNAIKNDERFKEQVDYLNGGWIERVSDNQVEQYFVNKMASITAVAGEENAKLYIAALGTELGKGEISSKVIGGRSKLNPFTGEDLKKSLDAYHKEVESYAKANPYPGTTGGRGAGVNGRVAEIDALYNKAVPQLKALGQATGEIFNYAADGLSGLDTFATTIENLDVENMGAREFKEFKESIKETNPELYEVIKNTTDMNSLLKTIPREIGINVSMTGMTSADVIDFIHGLKSVSTATSDYIAGVTEALEKDIVDIEQAAEKTKDQIKDSAEEATDAIEAGIKVREKANKAQNKAWDAQKKALEKKIKAEEDEIDVIEKRIDAINDEYDAREKALELAQEAADFARDQRQLDIDYQAALASGDYSGAAGIALQKEQSAADYARGAAGDQLQNERDAAIGVEEAKIKVHEDVIEGYQNEIDAIGEVQDATNEAFGEWKEMQQEKIDNINAAAEAEIKAIEDGTAARVASAKTTAEEVRKSTASQLANIQAIIAKGGDASAAIAAMTTEVKNQLTALGWTEAAASAYATDLANGLKNTWTSAWQSAFGLDPQAVLKGYNDSRKSNLGAGAWDSWKKSLSGEQRAAVSAITGTYHDGGMVKGRTPPHLKSGEVEAVLQTGEFVMQRSAVQSIGQERLEAANHPRFHSGGIVGRVPQLGALGGRMVGNMGISMMDKIGGMMMFDTVKRLKEGVQSAAIDAAVQVGAPGKNANAAYPSAFWGFPPNIPLTRIAAQGRSVSVNKNSAPYFQGLLNDLTAQGYAINSLGGYANRGNTSDRSKLSQHAFGNAIDINPAQNPYGQKLITNMPGNIQSLIAKNRLYWGGNWQTVKDAMHFEWAGPMKKGGKIKHDNTLAALHRGETVLTEPLTAKLGDAIKMAARPQIPAGMGQAGPTKVDNSVYNISVMAKTDADANEIARHIFRIQKDAQARQGWQS